MNISVYRPEFRAEHRQRATPRQEPTQPAGLVVRTKPYAGIWVDEQKALTLSTVWACVQLLSGTIASLAWHIFRRREDGDELLVQAFGEQAVLGGPADGLEREYRQQGGLIEHAVAAPARCDPCS